MEREGRISRTNGAFLSRHGALVSLHHYHQQQQQHEPDLAPPTFSRPKERSDVIPVEKSMVDRVSLLPFALSVPRPSLPFPCARGGRPSRPSRPRSSSCRFLRQFTSISKCARLAQGEPGGGVADSPGYSERQRRRKRRRRRRRRIGNRIPRGRRRRYTSILRKRIHTRSSSTRIRFRLAVISIRYQLRPLARCRLSICGY